MVKPIRLISGLNNNIIFNNIKNTPITTRQKTSIAKIKTNLKAPSSIVLKINYNIFYLHISCLCSLWSLFLP